MAGGTGGHIIPSVVFGTWLEKEVGISKIKYYTGNRPLEQKIFSFYKKKIKPLALSGSPRGTRGISALLRFFSMVYITGGLFFSFFFNPPRGLFLFGGYLCVPFIAVAKILGIPTVIHEQNALAGRTTRLGARFRIPICIGWPQCTFLDNTDAVFTGIPVRALRHLHVLDAWNKLVPDRPFPSGKIILVFGGSLGSSLLFDLALRLATHEDYKDCHFLVIAKEKKLFEEKKEKNMTLVEPQWDMSPLYILASAVIARGGGSTLAELLAYHIPGLIIPLSKSADGHQEQNARFFKDLGGGDLWKEEEPFCELIKRLHHILVMQKTSIGKTIESGENTLPSQRIFHTMTATHTKGDAPGEL